jgi:hypothetical protein
MTTDTELRVLELRDSVAWCAGTSYERRRVGEILRQRISSLQMLEGIADHRQPSQRSIRAVIAELRRLTSVIEEAA